MLMIVVILSSGLAVPNQITVSHSFIWFAGYVTPFKPIINTSYEAWNGTYMDSINLPGWNDAFHNITNLNGSSVFDFTKTYDIYSTIVLPGSNMGPVTILTIPEKICNIAVPYAWLAIIIVVVAKKFRWTNR
jgi:hypothetical protein